MEEYKVIARFMRGEQPAKFVSLVLGAWQRCALYYGRDYCNPLFSGYVFADPTSSKIDRKRADRQFQQLQQIVAGRENELLLTDERRKAAVKQWVSDIKEKQLWSEFVGEKHLVSHLPVEFDKKILVTPAGWSLYPTISNFPANAKALSELAKVAPDLFVNHSAQLRLLKERRQHEARLFKEDRLIRLLTERLTYLKGQVEPMMLTQGWSEAMKPKESWIKLESLLEPHKKSLNRYWKLKDHDEDQDVDLFQNKSFRDTHDNEPQFTDYIEAQYLSPEIKAIALKLVEIHRPDLFPTMEENEQRRREFFEMGRQAYRKRNSEAKRKEIISLVYFNEQTRELLCNMEVKYFERNLSNDQKEVCRRIRDTDSNELGCRYVRSFDPWRRESNITNPETFQNWQLLALAAWFDPEAFNESAAQ